MLRAEPTGSRNATTPIMIMTLQGFSTTIGSSIPPRSGIPGTTAPFTKSSAEHNLYLNRACCFQASAEEPTSQITNSPGFSAVVVIDQTIAVKPEIEPEL